MPSELTILEILGLAMRSEEEAAKFYGDLAKRIQNEMVRAKYESLAREEVSHRQLLANLYHKLSGEEAPPHIPGKPATAEGGWVADPASSLEELLEVAIRREQQARDFYLRLAPKLSDVPGRRTIEYLADIEHGHELLIAGELEAYRRDRNWYAEKPDIQLVGP
jgi:rubrerythrin